MSLIPTFELGLWNAWIITVLGFILPWIPSYINKEVANRRMEEIKWGKFSKTVKIILTITQFIIMPFTIIYSFFLPLKLGTVWFYVGLPISILGIIMPVISGVSLYSATAPLDKPITTGVYRISRNPEYFSGFLQYLGIGIGCLSWVFILCAVAWIISFHIQVVQSEEPSLIKKYGDAYKEYMSRTPRWIGFPKSKKQE
ncbi:isoprenylcysteine carboxylmethyltransferase family protein [Candidatus Bathyarchaeota archaeon]|nr:isoprenylcysteine carboxylmethyltransferase family protein [Candidatus Bathyarchaeota archaeon]